MLDASALLALINSEPGAERVVQALPGACISAVNLSEVAGKLVDKGVSEADLDSHLDGLEIAVIGFDRTAALAAAALRRVVPRSLSLGDRACLALGLSTGAVVLTADSQWQAIGLQGVAIVTIR